MLAVLLVLVVIQQTAGDTGERQTFASCQLELFKHKLCRDSDQVFVKDASRNPGGAEPDVGGCFAPDNDAGAGMPSCNEYDSCKDWTCADYGGPLPP